MLTWSKAIIGIDVIDKQAVHEVTTGSYLLLEQDAIMLGALQLRVDLPTGQTVTPELFPLSRPYMDFFSQHLLRESNKYLQSVMEDL